MRELIELQLPKLVEALDRKADSPLDQRPAQTSSPSVHLSQSSHSTDQAPISSTFSLRGPTRISSTSSSIASSPMLRSSLEDYQPSKSLLTDVVEEPVHEKVDDYEMVDAHPRDSRGLSIATTLGDAIADYFQKPTTSNADYEWIDTPIDTGDLDFAATKRHCADEPSSLNAVQSRVTTRLPSLSRKWKGKKDQQTSPSQDKPYITTPSRSRASSVKSPSIAESRFDLAHRRDAPLPPTPSQSGHLEASHHEESDSIDLLEAPEDAIFKQRPRSPARTPLLPPVMALKEVDQPVQSPLQSPSIADPSSAPQSPFDSPSFYSGLPSPPLSAKPSTASFHRRPVVPSAEIPPIRLAEIQDEWAIKLGHFDFTIEPKPYSLSNPVALPDCQRLRDDWSAARRGFGRHLAHAAETHGTSSKIFRLTEEKWATIDATWKQNYHDALESMRKASIEALHSQAQSPTQGPPSPTALPSSPVVSKFPEASIIGPMERAPSIIQKPSKKRAFWKFLQGVLPSSVAFGRSQA